MSLKGVALTGYLLVVGSLLLFSRASVLVGLGVVLITLAAVAAVTALSRRRAAAGDRRAEPPSFESNN